MFSTFNLRKFSIYIYNISIKSLTDVSNHNAQFYVLYILLITVHISQFI